MLPDASTVNVPVASNDTRKNADHRLSGSGSGEYAGVRTRAQGAPMEGAALLPPGLQQQQLSLCLKCVYACSNLCAHSKGPRRATGVGVGGRIQSRT